MAGNDQYTKLLLHCDGVGGSTSLPDASTSNHTVTAVGNAQVLGAKSGTGYVKFDGVSGRVVTPDHADWDFANGDFTVECWVYFKSIALYGFVMQGAQLGATGWGLAYNANNTLNWRINPSTDTGVSVSWTPVVNTWYHIAVTRSVNNYDFWINGVQQTTQVSAATSPVSADTVKIGWLPSWTAGSWFSENHYLNGFMDELRISNTVRYTANFTPPTIPYTADANTKLLVHFDVNNTGDSSASNHVLTYDPGAVIETGGKFAQSMRLDGVGDYALAADIGGNATGLSKGINYNFSVTGSFNRIRKLDTNKSIFVDKKTFGGDAIQATVSTISGTVITHGTTVDFAATDPGRVDVAVLATNKFIVGYRDILNSLLLTVGVGTVAGTTITAGTPVAHPFATLGFFSICKLDTDKALIVYNNHNNNRLDCSVISISGTVPTFNTHVIIESVLVTNVNLIQLSVDKALLIYKDNVNGNMYARVITVSGTTPTINALQTDAINAAGDIWDLVKLSASKAVLVFGGLNLNNDLTARVIDISGTTPTMQPNQILQTTTATPSQMGIDAVNSEQVLITWRNLDFASRGEAILASVSGSTITVDTTDVFEPTNAFYTRCAMVDVNKAIVSFSDADNSILTSLAYTLTGQPQDWQWNADYTVDMWIYPSDISGVDKPIIYNQGVGAGFWRLAYESSTSRIYISYGASIYYFAGSALTLNTWQHIALARSGTQTKLFIDGVQQGTAVTDSSIVDGLGLDLYIGWDGAAGYFNGQIDELRISNGIARWTANFAPPTAPYSIDALIDKLRFRKVNPVDIVTPEAIIW